MPNGESGRQCDLFLNAPIGKYRENHNHNLLQVKCPDGKIALVCEKCLSEFQQHLRFMEQTVEYKNAS